MHKVYLPPICEGQTEMYSQNSLKLTDGTRRYLLWLKVWEFLRSE